MIRSMQLNNFKCFEAQKIALKTLTLLTGLNGMGKSSVIQALLLLRQSYLHGDLQKNDITLNGELVHLGTGGDVLYEDASKDEMGIKLSWENGVNADYQIGYDKIADTLRLSVTHDGPEHTLYMHSLFTDNFKYLQAERMGPRTSFEFSHRQVVQHRQIGSHGEYAEHFLNVYRDEDIADPILAHESSDSKKLFSQVRAWLSDITPGTEIHLESHPEMDLIHLAFSFVSQGKKFRPTNVGFGLTYILPVLVAILSAKPGDLLILENPEAHLHPKGQAKMGSLMARAARIGIQIIVETHSDHVLNGIRVAVYQDLMDHDKVGLNYFFRAKNDKRRQSQVITPTIDKDGRIHPWPKDFFDEWDNCLDALLEPREP